ncbi:MAG: hypothetical protein MH204_08155 [Fimbriimonadaceae bacterium]|nr:hypothetical protein [Fimbriimonadaceae bacterium]
MSHAITLAERDKSEISLVGSYVEVYWSATNRLAKRQCEKCVYMVRGQAPGLVCLELIYDAIDGVHKSDAIYWVGIESVQYMRILSERSAQHRIETLEREHLEHLPKD